jgi:hypothetical protein
MRLKVNEGVKSDLDGREQTFGGKKIWRENLAGKVLTNSISI